MNIILYNVAYEFLTHMGYLTHFIYPILRAHVLRLTFLFENISKSLNKVFRISFSFLFNFFMGRLRGRLYNRFNFII